eukprot:CAMPEP_0203848824 /NCGR_PEP_ID=MMETSP0359-20131031/5822_1 /ASSEMBLY_ACC=CAM_ASM_000338 /TAXON_ID=268821 /ORGANISM="Scrippsiella Hangoei, Strain SHTV-5" /LENGTH=64 /DNA_ID=CAMNT_0050764477 /DNA_START=34 /DNA_END=225 /DNA_ORIENTATION=+
MQSGQSSWYMSWLVSSTDCPITVDSAAGPAGSVQKVTATAAMVQSATVMGQSVLLTSQLMYQLL